MSPNGLRDFLQGATPRSATRAKLERWLADQGTATQPPNVGQFVRLLNQLAVDLSTKKTQFGRAIGQLLVESYETRRLSPPLGTGAVAAPSSVAGQGREQPRGVVRTVRYSGSSPCGGASRGA